MEDLAYPACIRELYESEIFGEAAALALLDVSRNARDTYHFGTLLQLETETKARLRPFLAKHGIDLSEAMDLSDVPGIVATYRDNSWRDFAGAIKPDIEGFLSRFEDIARAGSKEDQDVLGSMVRHEAAILKWLDMESRGITEGSLAAMIDQLHFPLPEPTAP